MAFDNIEETKIEIPVEVKILIKARELISKGWCQHSLKLNNSKLGGYNYCSLGAIIEASGEGYFCLWENRPNASAALERLHRAKFGDGTIYIHTKASDIVSFNDSDLVTKQEVLDAFDKAIAIS